MSINRFEDWLGSGRLQAPAQIDGLTGVALQGIGSMFGWFGNKPRKAKTQGELVMGAYYIATKVPGDFDKAVDRVTEALKQEGFGVLTEIDVSATLKKKIGVDFRPYRILGACNPKMAHQALSAEDKIGVMLPCNVIVQQTDDGVEVAAVDPLASMQAIENPGLADIAGPVREALVRVIDSLR